ncbi:MAG: hypothetical protein ACT4PV_09150 [Planctomycetaceae bacterium]
MAQVGHLSELHEKYYAKGLRVIAISDEPSSTLKSKLIDAKSPKYWVASDPDRATVAGFIEAGRRGIPHSYIVDANGTVVGSGIPNEQQIEELLKAAFDPSLGRDLHPALKPLQKAYEKGDIGKAWAGAARYLENSDGEISRDAQFLREKAEAFAAWRRKLVEGALEAKEYGSAYADLKMLLVDYSGMEVATWAADQKKILDDDPVVEKELKGWEALEKARALEQKAEGKEKKLGPARSAYKSIVKKYPDTRAAKMAEEALARIGN